MGVGRLLLLCCRGRRFQSAKLVLKLGEFLVEFHYVVDLFGVALEQVLMFFVERLELVFQGLDMFLLALAEGALRGAVLGPSALHDDYES